MKKILFVSLFLTLFSYAKECKVDLYYATGLILAEDEEKSQRIWREQARNLLKKYPQLLTKVGSTKVAYNISERLVDDILMKLLMQ